VTLSIMVIVEQSGDYTPMMLQDAS